MKKNVFTGFAAAALVLGAVACQKADLLDNDATVERVPLTITAALENGQTKTSLQEGGKVHWENGDAMTIIAVGSDGAVTSYKFTTTDEGAEAAFTGGVELAENYYAVYPHTDAERLPFLLDNYKTSWQCSVVDSKLKVYFPSMQKVSKSGSTGLDAYSVGVVAADRTVSMKNLGGLIKINIPVEGVEHVILYGNADETIVGNAYVTFDEAGLPVVSSVDGSNMVRIVPASGSTFEVGEYYINVLPVTFTNGLSVIYTKSDDTWASVRSSGEFVVERSKVSSLPTVSALNFGGLVVDAIAVNDAGKSISLFTTNPPSSAKGGGTDKTGRTSWTLKNTDYNFGVYCSYALYKTSGSGICFGKSVGDYLETPAIDGYALNKVIVRTSVVEKPAGSPQVQDINGDPVVGGATWTVDKKPYGIEHAWSFNGAANASYRLVQTVGSDYSQYHQVRLYYAAVNDGVSTIKPLITSVTTAEAQTDPANDKVTFNGTFTSVDYSASALTCGFEYKTLAETDDWTSVTCAQTSPEFSYDFATESEEDYVYRAWVKVNTSSKIVYGEEVQFNPRKLVLHLVFDDNYLTREDKYNFLLRDWKWGTNGNSTNENPNGATYYYTYKGVEYPFTFWSYRVKKDETSDSGGYALWVSSQSERVQGLTLAYGKGLADSMPAWMQLPSAANMRLAEIQSTFYAAFPGTIASAVNEDGTASGTEIASFEGERQIELVLNGTEKDTRYYFCTTDNQNPTLRNLTLTYLYVGE